MTDDFLHVVHVQRAALGLERLEPVVVAHPLSTLSEAEIGARAAEALPQIKRVLLGE